MIYKNVTWFHDQSDITEMSGLNNYTIVSWSHEFMLKCFTILFFIPHFVMSVISSFLLARSIKTSAASSRKTCWWWEMDVWTLWSVAEGYKAQCGFVVNLVYRVWRMWWGLADWGGLSIWSIGVWMIGCQPVEMWRWQRWGVGVGAERLGLLGENVWMMTWKCLLGNIQGYVEGLHMG